MKHETRRKYEIYASPRKTCVNIPSRYAIVSYKDECNGFESLRKDNYDVENTSTLREKRWMGTMIADGTMIKSTTGADAIAAWINDSKVISDLIQLLSITPEELKHIKGSISKEVWDKLKPCTNHRAGKEDHAA